MHTRLALLGFMLPMVMAMPAVQTGSRLHTPASGPAPPPLGTIPRQCPASPVRTIDASLSPEVGTFPLWGWGFSGSHATLDYGRVPDPRDYYPVYGWVHKFDWNAKASFKGRITLYGAGLYDRAPVWFEIATHPRAERRPILDLRHPPANSQPAPGYADFPGDLYVPRAGCYYIEARWPGGGWRITFAAGRRP